MANFYMIVYDPDDVNTAGLKDYVNNHPDFINWWHYLRSAYVIKTDLYLADINTQLQQKWPKNRHLIIKIDPSVRNGWLKQDAWNWFRKHS